MPGGGLARVGAGWPLACFSMKSSAARYMLSFWSNACFFSALAFLMVLSTFAHFFRSSARCSSLSCESDCLRLFRMALACVACVVTAFLSWLGMVCGVVKSIGSAISDGVVGLELRGGTRIARGVRR